MMQHKQVQRFLYDYVLDEMEPRTKEEVRQHLDKCERCSRDLGEFRLLLSEMPHESGTACHSMEQREWDVLFASIMEHVKREEGRRTTLWSSRFEAASSFVRFRPAYAMAAGIALSILAILLFLNEPVSERESVTPHERLHSPNHAAGEEEIGRYFRKSKALLVGLSNLDTQPGLPVDLSVERELSRQLILEGRSLREQRIDPRSSRLIGDLDRIMERVSSTTETVHPPEIQIIRSDIRGQNLLVKLRVAEASYSTIPVTKVRESQ